MPELIPLAELNSPHEDEKIDPAVTETQDVAQNSQTEQTAPISKEQIGSIIEDIKGLISI